MPPTMVSGQELLHELSFIDGITPTRVNGVFDVATPGAMVLAQIELSKARYYLSQSTMDEGHFYRQRFMPHRANWPYYVTLRYVSDPVLTPALALMYFKDGVATQYIRAGFTTYGTYTSNGETMLTAFLAEHPDTAWFWMPVFPGSPLARM